MLGHIVQPVVLATDLISRTLGHSLGVVGVVHLEVHLAVVGASDVVEHDVADLFLHAPIIHIPDPMSTPSPQNFHRTTSRLGTPRVYP